MEISRVSIKEINNLKYYLEKKNTPVILTDLFNNWPSLEIARNSSEKILRNLISHATPQLVDTLVVDKRYNGLIGYSDESLLLLQKNGMLEAIYSHLISLGQFQRLIDKSAKV